VQTTDPSLNEEDIIPLLHYFAAQLPQKTKEVFLLSRTNNLTYKEIAQEMNISIKTVENQMGRALRMMRQLLKDQKYLSLMAFLGL
jgi:RNA polymerase sigma-70 factor (ECF subfamily)